MVLVCLTKTQQQSQQSNDAKRHHGKKNNFLDKNPEISSGKYLVVA
jgi:hypothetical protein